MRALVLQQSFGLLLADDDGFDLRRVHVDVEFPADKQAYRGGKLGLGLQHLGGLLLNDEGAETRSRRENQFWKFDQQNQGEDGRKRGASENFSHLEKQ